MIDILNFRDDKYQPTNALSDNFNLRHGMESDYACFAIWNGALCRQDEIVQDLAREFQLLADYEVH